MSQVQTVLVVDDEPRNLRIFEEILEGFCALRSAATGDEALRLVEDFVPDLVLLDIMMPGLNGYEVCKQLKSNPKLELMRVILVSGRGRIDEKLKGYEVGADDYIVKPFIPEELGAKAKVYLRLVKAERALLDLNNNLEEKIRLRSEQLLKSETLAFVGAHTAEIVHNLNNPLTILNGNISQLEQLYPQEAKLKKAMNAIMRLNDTIKSILASSRQATDQSIQLCDINQIIRNELKLLEAEKFFKYEIQLHLDLGQISPLRGQVNHFAQSLGNLIKNAVESMYGREKKELSVRSYEQNQVAIVEISDTGCGIARENFEKIFDPFFTTKALEAKGDEPVGTGLGLASVKRMLEAYGARIELDSEVGKGSLFRIFFPIRSNEAFVNRSAKDDLETQAVPNYQPAPMPANEKERLNSLLSFQVLDSVNERILNDLVELAASICETPMSAVSLIDEKRQWFKASKGLNGIKETSRDISFCGHAIQGKIPFIVEDATSDPRFAGNPIVLNTPKIHFYAGVPLITPDGFAIGTLCVLDQASKKLNPNQVSCLQTISRLVMTYLEWRRAVLDLIQNDRLYILWTDSFEILQKPINSEDRSLEKVEKLQDSLEKGIQDIESFSKSVNSSESTLKNILEFMKTLKSLSFMPMSGKYFSVSLNSCIEAALSQCEPRIAQDSVRVTVPIIPDSLTLECQKDAISHLLFYLIDNSLDAIQNLSEKWIMFDVVDQGNEIEIGVIDSGKKIHSEIKDKIFEPFYSTKINRKGMGLSLSTARKIAVSHQGSLSVDLRSPNARFFFRLPKRLSQKL